MGVRGLVFGVVISVAALSACSKPQRNDDPSEGPSALRTFDTAEQATDSATSGRMAESRSAIVGAPGPPRIGPSAAPGVAFAYRYAFQLADDKISAVQEAHAARCEVLGVAKCRIVGLNYTIGDNDVVSAHLDLKLDPQIARGYGREATGTVTQAGGRLSQTEFTGEDTAPATDAAVATGSDAETRIAGVRRRIAQPGLRDVERAQLQAQLDALQNQANDAKATLAATRVKLASTPMSFSYYGKGGISGFAGRDPLFEAGQSFVGSLVTMITVVLQLLAVVVPWLLLLGVFILLWRTPPARALVRWWRTGNRKDVQDEVAAGATPD